MAEFKLNYTGEEVQEKLDNCGSGGVTSWNDLTDKPFHSHLSEVGFADEPKVYTFNTDADGYAEIEQEILTVGNGYTIKVNGKMYYGVAKDHSEGCPVNLHNSPQYHGYFVKFESSDNKPCDIVIASVLSVGYSGYTEFHNFPANSEVTIEFGLGEAYETVKTIDEKFLSGYVMYKNKPVYGFLLKNDNDVVYRVYVTDDGQLAVEEC